MIQTRSRDQWDVAGGSQDGGKVIAEGRLSRSQTMGVDSAL